MIKRIKRLVKRLVLRGAFERTFWFAPPRRSDGQEGVRVTTPYVLKTLEVLDAQVSDALLRCKAVTPATYNPEETLAELREANRELLRSLRVYRRARMLAVLFGYPVKDG